MYSAKKIIIWLLNLSSLVKENIIIEKILLNVSFKCEVYTTVVILVFQAKGSNNKYILLCDSLKPFYIKNYVEIKKDETIKLNKGWTSIKNKEEKTRM